VSVVLYSFTSNAGNNHIVAAGLEPLRLQLFYLELALHSFITRPTSPKLSGRGHQPLPSLATKFANDGVGNMADFIRQALEFLSVTSRSDIVWFIRVIFVCQ
jgi:hypothetical protein